MSKPKSKGAKPAKDAGPSGGKGKSSAREQSAIRGMLLGAAIIAALAGFFMMPIKGKTTFTHLIHAIGLQGGETETAKDAGKGGGKGHRQGQVRSGAPESNPKPARAARRRPPGGGSRRRACDRSSRAGKTPAKPQGIKVATGLKARAPLEAASAADDAALDRIVRRHTQN
jgi:hypothetical protein